MGERTFDVIQLGAGPAGEVCAGRLADGGLSVVIVERELIGGECSSSAAPSWCASTGGSTASDACGRATMCSWPSGRSVQIDGGYGYIVEYPVCRFYRDAKILTIGEGTDEVQQMVIARQLTC